MENKTTLAEQIEQEEDELTLMERKSRFIHLMMADFQIIIRAKRNGHQNYRTILSDAKFLLETEGQLQVLDVCLNFHKRLLADREARVQRCKDIQCPEPIVRAAEKLVKDTQWKIETLEIVRDCVVNPQILKNITTLAESFADGTMDAIIAEMGKEEEDARNAKAA